MTFPRLPRDKNQQNKMAEIGWAMKISRTTTKSSPAPCCCTKKKFPLGELLNQKKLCSEVVWPTFCNLHLLDTL